ncbi:hypothetical protein [Bacillus sp. JCM 19041]|uniref:hypothetical protein n=1 Tax=Bacillus sp. JCM 19041 TaxID=1460637 RepID=UPI0006D1C5BA
MNKMDAAFMTGVVFGDQQFSLPEFPKLIEEIDIITLNDLQRIIFYGNESPQILGGNAINSLLPRVISELDGKKSLSEICSKLSEYSSNHIIQAINMLYIRGIIEEGRGVLDKDVEKIQLTVEGRNSLSFFSRFVDTTRVNKSGYESFMRMNDKDITIITNDVIDDYLHSQFYIGKNILDLADWKRFSEDICDNDLIIYVGSYDNHVHHSLLELNEFCFRNDTPLLISIYDSQVGYLAYIEKNETPCYKCLSKNYFYRLSSNKKINEYHKKMWINMISLEIKYRLSRISVGLTADYRYSFKFSDFTSEREKTVFEVDCSCKYNSQLKNAEFSLTAVEYDHSVTFPSQHLNGPKGHQVHYSGKNMQMSREFKKYNNSLLINCLSRLIIQRGKSIALALLRLINRV